ncbi:MAG: hypothetical protein ACLUUG_12825 [Lachnospiraceae bacterium]
MALASSAYSPMMSGRGFTSIRVNGMGPADFGIVDVKNVIQ